MNPKNQLFGAGTMHFASCAWWIPGVLLAALTAHGLAGEVNDTEGFRWDFQEDGSIDEGSNDTFDGGLRLIINGHRFRGGKQEVTADGRGVAAAQQDIGGLNVTRKAWVSDKAPGCRFLEIIENLSGQPIQVKVTLYTDLGETVQGSIQPESRDGRVAYLAVDQSQGKGSSLAYCMASMKNKLLVRPQARGQDVTLVYDPIMLKTNDRIALLHVCAQRNSLADAEAFAKKINWTAILGELEKGDRALVRNVQAGDESLSVGGVELFRGEGGDTVCLNSGERLSGQLKLPAFPLETEWGEREVAAEEVLSLFDAGENVRLVCRNGEVLTGKLRTPALKMKLHGGEEVDIPVHCIAKYGKRIPPAATPKEKEMGDTEPAKFADPVFTLRNGDRLVGQPAAEKLEFFTLYGPLSVGWNELRRIEFPNATLRTPVVELADGASFSALPAGNTWAIKLVSGATVTLDEGRLGTISCSAGVETGIEKEPEAALPKPYAQLRLLNQDVFCGTLTSGSPLMMDTPFGKRQIGADQIMRLKPRSSGAYHLRVTLWDGNVFPARLAESTIRFTTNSGAQLKVPLGMLKLYWRPLAVPTAGETARIEGLIAKLGDGDPQVREETQKALLETGHSARLLLAKHWKDEDLERRARVRRLLEQLQETAPSETLDDEE